MSLDSYFHMHLQFRWHQDIFLKNNCLSGFNKISTKKRLEDKTVWHTGYIFKSRVINCSFPFAVHVLKTKLWKFTSSLSLLLLFFGKQFWWFTNGGITCWFSMNFLRYLNKYLSWNPSKGLFSQISLFLFV